jgi:hypothetical protein
VFYNFSTTNYPSSKASGWILQDGSGITGNPMLVIDDIYMVPKVLSNQYVTAVDAQGCVAQQTYRIGAAPGMKRKRYERRGERKRKNRRKNTCHYGLT